jgi:hypothetical protein
LLCLDYTAQVHQLIDPSLQEMASDQMIMRNQQKLYRYIAIFMRQWVDRQDFSVCI